MRPSAQAAAIAVFCACCAAGSAWTIQGQRSAAAETMAARHAAWAESMDEHTGGALETAASVLAQALDGQPAEEIALVASEWARDFKADAVAKDPAGAIVARTGRAEEEPSIKAFAKSGCGAAGDACRVSVTAIARPAVSDLAPGLDVGEVSGWAATIGLGAAGAAAACCLALGRWRPSARTSLSAALAAAGLAAAVCSASVASSTMTRSMAELDRSKASDARMERSAHEDAERALPRFVAALPGRTRDHDAWALRMVEISTELPRGSAIALIDAQGVVAEAWGAEAFSARAAPAPKSGRDAAALGIEAFSNEPCGDLGLPCASVAEPTAGGGAVVVQRRVQPESFKGFVEDGDGWPFWLPAASWCMALGAIAIPASIRRLGPRREGGAVDAP